MPIRFRTRSSSGLTIITAGHSEERIVGDPCPLHTLRELSGLDYCNSQSALLPVEITALECLEQHKGRTATAKGRDFSVFGVKRIGGFSGTDRATVNAGEQLDFFWWNTVPPTGRYWPSVTDNLEVMTGLSITALDAFICCRWANA